MGLATVSGEGFNPARLPRGFKSKEKIVVFTLYAQFHLQMKSYLESLGLSAEIVNGSLTAKLRDKVIAEFREGTKNVLLMSNVGSTGMDLTFARTVVVYVSLDCRNHSDQLTLASGG
jgi:superfamily II DNA/RNA helicase